MKHLVFTVETFDYYWQNIRLLLTKRSIITNEIFGYLLMKHLIITDEMLGYYRWALCYYW